MILHLRGTMTIGELTQVLSEVASFCGEDSEVTLTDFPITLAIAQFVEDPDEQKDVAEHMIDALGKYGVHAELSQGG